MNIDNNIAMFIVISTKKKTHKKYFHHSYDNKLFKKS